MTAICSEASFHRAAPLPGAWLFARFGAWRQRARERNELSHLDSRLLADIGLSPAEAEFIINKPFWRS